MTRLLMLGAGHAHLIAAPRLAKARGQNLQIALVAPSETLLYSGMIPGWIAGQYRFDECAIDVGRVCRDNGIEWLRDEIVDIDFLRREAIGSGDRHRFDLLSVDVGSATDLGAIGADSPPVLGARPFANFVPTWQAWRDGALDTVRARRMLVVGGGAAAVEIAFALVAQVRAHPSLAGSEVSLAAAGERLLERMAPAAGALSARSLSAHGVRLFLGRRYVGAGGGHARFEGSEPLEADLVIVANGARPPDWLTACAARDGVAVAADGGLAIRSNLCSTSHAAVFAAGDCASFVDQRVQKSGVHALRQGPVLARNLARSADAQECLVARRWTLALLNRCDGSAIGAWGPVGFAGRWAWNWKDRIDRRFVERFR